MVAAGFATGFEIFGLLSPAVGDQVYVEAPEEDKVVFPPPQMVALGPTETTGELVAVTITG